MSMEVKLFAYLGSAFLLLLLTVFGVRHFYDWAYHNGASDNQMATARITADAIAKATAQRDAALKANEAITDDLQTKLDGLSTSSADLAERLRLAEDKANASNCAVPKPKLQRGAIAAAEPASASRLDAATAAAIAECIANEDKYDALVREINARSAAH
jgi:hypothetical protein